MAANMHSPKQINLWVWGGAAVAAIAVIAALGYGIDWFGLGSVETTTPAIEQTAPATG